MPKLGQKPLMVIGALVDWPIGARLSRLLSIPDTVASLGYYITAEEHADAASELVFATKERVSTGLESAVESALAALPLLGDGGRGFHVNLSPEKLRATVAKAFEPMSPRQAIDAKVLPPKKTLAQLEKRLAKADWDRAMAAKRPAILKYLKGETSIDALRERGLDAHDLAGLAADPPERWNEVDERLFRLWFEYANSSTRLPYCPPREPPHELGADRFASLRDRLVGAGMSDDDALDCMIREAAGARWWSSTGLWVWERLLADPRALSKRALALSNGPHRLADLYAALLLLPETILARGALAAALRTLEDEASIPAKVLTLLCEQSLPDAILAALHPIAERRTRPKAVAEGKRAAVKVGIAKPLKAAKKQK
jgi:hypothetical protein